MNNFEREKQNVGSGWWPLVEEVHRHFVGKYGEDYDLHQIKEKFGELRFYVGHHDDDDNFVVDQAERKSRETCEVCGAPSPTGPHPYGGWIVTLCADHGGKRAAWVAAGRPPGGPEM